MSSGIDRFVADQRRIINLDEQYIPFPKQSLYHASGKPYNFLGGAAGPGKSLAMIMENMISCQEFSMADGPQVHTLMLRRTQPKVRNTLVTRFREKIPQELYKSFNETSLVVTWLNGATTNFGSMQYEHSWMDWQGQWYRIFFDELCEFTYAQWNGISAWNRCPVSQKTRKDGAGNPIGVGAPWVRRLFVDKRPPDEMDEAQRRRYRPESYAYFPCTYLDNPIFANDPTFIERLQSYPERIRKALMEGSWDVVGGYFEGAFDAALNVCEASECDPKPWHKRWISGDWGFEHYSAIYWHYMDDFGVLRTYKEKLVQHHDPEMLAEMIVRESYETDKATGNTIMPRFVSFPFSHDAFANQTTKSYGANPNSVALRMGRALAGAGVPLPSNSGKDKVGREQTMYNMLRRQIWDGTYDDNKRKNMTPNWKISEDCPRLIDTIGMAPRDEKKIEQIASFLGDDPLQGAGYGVYWILGKPAAKPEEELLRERLAKIPDDTARQMARVRATLQREARQDSEDYRRPSWMET